MKKLVLVGCVKSKCDAPSAAKDLYDSPLWRSRRAYAERFGTDWYILSAKHGLVAPEKTIAPYDLALTDLRAAERRTWSQKILDNLAATVPELRGSTIEIHAGKAYAEFGLEDGLDNLGAKVRRPLAHISGIGAQIAWYAEQLRLSDTPRLAEFITADFYNDRFDPLREGTGTAYSLVADAGGRSHGENPHLWGIRTGHPRFPDSGFCHGPCP